MSTEVVFVVIDHKKHRQKYFNILSLLLLLVIGVYAVTSNVSWVILGPPPNTTHYRDWDILSVGFDSNHNPETTWSVNFTVFHSQAVIYAPHQVKLLNYSINANNFPSSPVYDALGHLINVSVLSVTAWFFINIFMAVKNSSTSTSYKLVDTVTRSVPLNSSHLVAQGSVFWNPSVTTEPFGIDNADLNFSYTWLSVATDYEKNLTSGTIRIGWASIGSTLNTSYLPPSLDVSNPEPIPLGYGIPNNGIFFLYKLWSVGYNIGLIGLGIVIVIVLPFLLKIRERIAPYFKKLNTK